MPQSGQTPIQLYRSATPSAVPAAVNLVAGELAINTIDGNLFFKDSSNVVRLLASTAAATGTVSSVNASGGTTGLTFTGGPITTSGTLTLGGTLAVANGGTGATDAATARSNLGAGTVNSVSGTGTVNGITLTGTVTNTGNLTLGGTLSGVSLTAQVTGVLPVASGGTGATTSTGTGSVVLNNTPTFAGTILAPDNGVKFASDGGQDTGFQWVSDGVFVATANNAEVARFSSGLGVSTPISFTAQQNYFSTTGGYWLNANGLFQRGIALSGGTGVGIYAGGAERITINSTGNTGFLATPVSEFTTNTAGVAFAQSMTTDRFGVMGTNLYFAGGSFRAAAAGWGAGWALGGANGETVRLLATTGAASTRGEAVTTTERIVVLSNGNVGIGTGTPAYRLEANGTFGATEINANAAVGFRNLSGVFQYNEARNPHLAHYKVSSDSLAYYWRTTDNGAFDGPNQRTLAEWYNNRLLFFTNNLERVRIDPSGFVGIGTGTPSEALNVVGNILASGNITAFSDERLKDNVETITKALDKVQHMRGVTYTLKETGEMGTGVIAQEMLTVMPEVVNTNGEHMAVAYGNLVGVLIEAIKELSAEVAELRGRSG